MAIWQAIILAIVEGVTEYLPISSTGHMIVVNHLLGLGDDPFTKTYTVAVQFGAILAAVFLFRARFLREKKIYWQLLLAFVPAGLIGFIFKKKLDVLLGSVEVVGWALLLGGIVIVLVEKFYKPARTQAIGELSNIDCVKIGVFQALAMIPGVSRAAATIWGGQFVRLDRKSAAEFSFLLAVPTLTAATVLKLWQFRHDIQPDHILILILGNLISFVVGALAIKGFVHYLQKYSMAGFGYYRIIFGAVILAALASGISLG